MKEHVDFVMGHELIFGEKQSLEFFSVLWAAGPGASSSLAGGPFGWAFGAQAQLNHQRFWVKQSFPHVQDAHFKKKMQSFTFILAQLSSGSE